MEDIDRQVVVLERTGVRLCLSQETISTAITLLFTPVYYSVIDDLSHIFRRRKKSAPAKNG